MTALNVKTFFRTHRPVVILAGAILILTTIPILETFLVVGNSWQGILPVFGDELNFTRIHTIGEGNLTDGNAYYAEHRDGPPLVLFGGAWLNAIPLWAGLPFNTTLLLNFIIWSLLFAGTLYCLFRELRVSRWTSVAGTILLYIESYAHVWRPVNLQPVFPFYFLFYLALSRFLREQSRRAVLLLGGVIGATFYLYTFLWQGAVLTMGILFCYALARKNWPLLKATTLSSLVGGSIGLPVLLYILWLARVSPYFWESTSRLGLVNTHLPMAEVIYSGGWIGVVLALLAALYRGSRELREDSDFRQLAGFTLLSGIGLWILQGSNFITGKLTETGEHVKLLIMPWLLFSTISIGVLVWKRQKQFSKRLRAFSFGVLMILGAVNTYYIYYYFSPFLTVEQNQAAWQTEQLYAKPLAWIDSQQKEPVVVWTDPHDELSELLPVYSRDFTLDSYWGMLELAPQGEIQERYLVSQYFNNPSLADITSDTEMDLYLGRADMNHKPATYNRGVKICRLFFFWDKNKDCGTLTTARGMLGDAFFSALERKFQQDIRPNIQAYLQKYHVSYIMKDKILDTKYQPETLGATLVYTDDRYEVYRLP
jgi:hypothetical protein